MRIEYRFLQVILSHVSNDRITVGLLHWDGSLLRVAYAINNIPTKDPMFRDTVKRTVTVVMRRAQETAREIHRKPVLNVGLKHIFQVRDGLGASLFWSPIQTVQFDGVPGYHFEELKRQINLDQPLPRISQKVTNHELRKRLITTGQLIQWKAPGLIKIEHETQGAQKYVSPLSWKNSKWHHAIPFSLDGMNKTDMDAKTRDLYGIIQLAIPKGDVSVVLAVYPDSPELKRIADDERRILLAQLPLGAVEIESLPRDGRNVQLANLEHRILSDVREAKGEQ